MVICDSCGENVDLYYESEGKNLCLSCYDKYEDSKNNNVSQIPKNMEYVCSVCNKRIWFRKTHTRFFNENKELVIICKKCYKKLPSKEKIKLSVVLPLYYGMMCYTTKNSWMSMRQGFVNSSFNKMKKTIDEIYDKYDLTTKDVNKFSIENFNKHFFMCGPYLKVDIMKKMSKDLEIQRLNEISQKKLLKDYNKCNRQEKKQVKKELKTILTQNLEKNKDRASIF